MDIQEFFQLSAGKWFSQRTSHRLDFPQIDSSKSDIIIEIIPTDSISVVKICQQHNVAPTLAWGGVQVTWDSTTEQDKIKRTSSTVVVPIADLDNPNQGKLLQETSNGQTPDAGRYAIGSDDTLTLITENDRMYSEERISFASNNLRLRTSVVKQLGNFSTTSFWTEIRMGVVQPPAQT